VTSLQGQPSCWPFFLVIRRVTHPILPATNYPITTFVEQVILKGGAMTPDDFIKDNEEANRRSMDLVRQLEEAMIGETFDEEQLATIERMKELCIRIMEIGNVFAEIAKAMEDQPPPEMIRLMAEFDALDPNDAKAKELWWEKARHSAPALPEIDSEEERLKEEVKELNAAIWPYLYQKGPYDGPKELWGRWWEASRNLIEYQRRKKYGDYFDFEQPWLSDRD
jgi:hypothetical protein